MKIKNLTLGMLAVAVTLALSVPAQAGSVPQTRLDAIYAMTPEEMARTGAWVRGAYDDLMAQIYGMENKTYRDLVLDMVTNPRSEVYDAPADKDSYRVAPPTGGPGHHHYPGGLAVHALENIQIAFGWADTMEKLHKVKNVDRDLVVASLVLHDWAKVWYEWDDKTSKVQKPEWYPKSWGGEDGKAKWKWMGEHGAVVYAELMKRGAPEELIVATAAAHFDPQWDLDKDGEGLNPALAEAAKIVDMPPIVVTPDKRMAEWWLSVYSDGSWSFSHYVAGKFAHKAIREAVADLGIDPESSEANKLALFVLSRVSDFKIYSTYQNAGFDMDAVKQQVVSILEDSSAYEVPAN